ncbi:hypothetical protein Pelo_16675 [Pelomyxa schiedti]|nr:hypothetical protein Pelo_16675 [Pelomyxa schiedti]
MEIVPPIVWPIIKKIFTCSCCKKDKHVRKSKRPEFEVAEEYLELLYRQFVVGGSISAGQDMHVTSACFQNGGCWIIAGFHYSKRRLPSLLGLDAVKISLTLL